MPVINNDNAIVLAVVAEVIRRQPVDASTDEIVTVALATEAKAATAVRLARESK